MQGATAGGDEIPLAARTEKLSSVATHFGTSPGRHEAVQ